VEGKREKAEIGKAESRKLKLGKLKLGEWELRNSLNDAKIGRGRKWNVGCGM
jgi:hypothetical protein